MSRLSLLGKSRRDRVNLRILAALSESGRETIIDLSKKIALSATPCSTRVEQLEADHLILGYQAVVDVERLAELSLYYVTIALKSYTPELGRKVEAIVLSSPYIVSCDALFGSLDYMLQVYARSTQHYHEIMAPFLSFEIDYTTHPVSKRVMRHQTHRLLAQIAKEL